MRNFWRNLQTKTPYVKMVCLCVVYSQCICSYGADGTHSPHSVRSIV